MSTTSKSCPDLLPFLRQTFPSIQSYTVFGTITQANAEGYKLELKYNDDNNDFPTRVFVKQVIAADYVPKKKDWADLRRTLMYARTEARFYSNMLPVMKQKGFTFIPQPYLAEYYLEDWIDEKESATTPADVSIDKSQLPNAQDKGGIIIMECVSDVNHFQDSPLTIQQCKQCLSAVATMHIAAWQDVPLLQQAELELSKASFHLSTRNPKELADIVEAWDSFSAAFRDELQAANLWTNSVRQLGQRVFQHAHYISKCLTPQPTDKFATIVHGDYKPMNAFLPTATDANPVLVDYASTGVGLGMSDVAMHIFHAMEANDLANGGEEELVQHYIETIQASVDFPDDVAMRHYRLGVVDYFRFFLGRFWKSATKESMLSKKDNKNISLINRSPEAAIALVGRVDQYLTEIEKEVAEQS